jgi:hypothetical protein
MASRENVTDDDELPWMPAMRTSKFASPNAAQVQVVTLVTSSQLMVSVRTSVRAVDSTSCVLQLVPLFQEISRPSVAIEEVVLTLCSCPISTLVMTVVPPGSVMPKVFQIPSTLRFFPGAQVA